MQPLRSAAFLFTDIEGSTHLWEDAPDSMRAALEQHDNLLRASVENQGGLIFKTTGDGLHAVFDSCPQAINAAVAGQQALLAGSWPLETGSLHVRMGVHFGEVQPRAGDFFGATLNRTARIMAAAHGGQILVSAEVASQIADALPTGAALRDMGKHRMKGLAHLEHLYQVVVPGLPADFPRLNTLDVTPTNLPVQLTSFIGRAEALLAVESLLNDHRLVTLTGPGGCGKTRLALKVAEEVQDSFPHGVWLTELALLSDPALVPQAVAQALGLRPDGARPLTDVLADYLRPRCVLLVLDNCEHLVDSCAQLAEWLLHACPELRILASSRESLNIAGEACFVVPSMATPNPRRLPPLKSLNEVEAVRLFVERASAIQPTFLLNEQNAPAVARICQQLDGIPLALELAAARVRVLTPEQIAARLDDRFHLLTSGSRTALPRQQTLRALIDWSYDLLSEPERTLFRRMSIFAGGCTLDAAETVCAGGDISADDVLELLTSLTDKSLVFVEEAAGEANFQRLETIRQYALEKFLETGEVEAVRDRHLDFFVALAEQAEPELTGPAQQMWTARLEREQENIRAALRWAEARDPLAGVRIVSALRWFWDAHEHYVDACDWLARVVEREEIGLPPRARARALSVLAFLSIARYDIAHTEALANEADRACRKVDDTRGLALSLLTQGITANIQGERTASETLLLDSLDMYRALCDRAGQVDVLLGLGANVIGHRDFIRARGYLEAALALCRELGHLAGIAQCLQGLGSLALRHGDLMLAEQWLNQSTAALRVITAQDISSSSELLGELAYWQGNYTEARARFQESLRLSEELGHQLTATWATIRLGYVEMQQGNIQAARAVFRQSMIELRERNVPVGVVFAVEGMAALAEIEGQPERAAQLLAWADTMRAEIDDPRPPVEQDAVNRMVTRLANSLGERSFAEAQATSRAMAAEEAIRLAFLHAVADNSTMDALALD